MAGLAHGNAILTTVGFSTGRTLRQAAFFESVPVIHQEAFMEKTKHLIEDSTRRRELGNAARLTYEREYDWPRLKEKLLAQLEKIRRV